MLPPATITHVGPVAREYVSRPKPSVACFAALSSALYRKPMSVHPTAIIDPLATIDSTTTIGPYAVISGPVRIGPGCRIAASAIILGDTEIGAGCAIHSHAVIGDVPQDRAFHGGPSFCRIGDNCTIREGATVHRGSLAETGTIIGDGCL